MVAFRRNFSELKTATERDLSHVKGDLTKTARSMQSACLNLNANLRNADTESQVSVLLIESRDEKTNVLVSDLVRHKPGCTASTTEDG